jgi:hypothetical protein
LWPRERSTHIHTKHIVLKAESRHQKLEEDVYRSHHLIHVNVNTYIRETQCSKRQIYACITQKSVTFEIPEPQFCLKSSLVEYNYSHFVNATTDSHCNIESKEIDNTLYPYLTRNDAFHTVTEIIEYVWKPCKNLQIVKSQR